MCCACDFPPLKAKQSEASGWKTHYYCMEKRSKEKRREEGRWAILSKLVLSGYLSICLSLHLYKTTALVETSVSLQRLPVGYLDG